MFFFKVVQNSIILFMIEMFRFLIEINSDRQNNR